MIDVKHILTQISELAGMCHAGGIMTDESKEEELFFDLESKLDELHEEIERMVKMSESKINNDEVVING